MTTIQKFQYVSEVLSEDDSLKKIWVAFLIDEAYRSQEGKGGRAIRYPFKSDIKAGVVCKNEVNEGMLPIRSRYHLLSKQVIVLRI